MSLLNRLTIQGIRSFGIDPEDAQRIEFTPPVTLIVGENGCGKTTIIECLKYALTGDLPPGSNNGKNFIHKGSVDRTSYLGKVTLTVTDENQVDKTVTRTMKLDCPKGKAPKFETLNSSITFLHKNGQRADISGRGNDINEYMCSAMGVSKSILNNVIFCHQEDSNWPLDEGKKVKEKFDSIFGTTEYNKAIDKLIKIRKDYQKSHSDVKSDIKYNEEIKSQVDAKERKIKQLKAQFDENEKKFQEYNDSLLNLEEENKKIMEKEKDYGKLYTEKLNCKNLLSNKMDEYHKLRENIDKNGQLEGDIESLKKQQLSFESGREEKKLRMETLQTECKDLKTVKENKSQNVAELNGKIHEYTSDYQRLQKLLDERFEKMKELCAKLEIPFTDDVDQSFNTQMISDSIDDIYKYISNANRKLLSLKSEAQEEDNRYQQKIDESREERTKLETNIATQRKSINILKENIEKTRVEIKSCEASIPMLKKLQPQIESVEKKLNKLNSDNNVEELEDQQSLLQASIIELEESLASIDNDIEILHSASKYTNEHDSKQAELIKNQSEFSRLKNKSTSNFKTLFPSRVIDSNFKSQLTSRQSQLESEIASMENKLKAKQHENERISIQIENLRKSEEKLEKEIKSIERKLRDLCGGLDYLSVLESQKEKVAKQNMELAFLESSKNMYKKYIEKINDATCCPLCSKDLQFDEADNLIEELKDNIDQLPRKTENVRKMLKAETLKFDQLNGMKSSYDSLQQLKNEKAKTEEKLKELEEGLLKNNEEISDYELNLSEPRALLDMIKPSFMAEMMKLDDLQRAINSKTKEIDDIKLKIPKNIPKIKLSDAMTKRKEIMENIKTTNEKDKKLEKEVSEYKNKLMDMRDELNSLITKRNEYQAKMQGIDKMKEQYEKYIKEKSNLESQLDAFEQQFEPINEKLDALLRKKNEKRTRNNEKIEEEQKSLNKLQVDKNNLDDLNKQIKVLEDMNICSKIDQVSLKIEKRKEEIKKIENDLTQKENEMQEIRDILNKGEMILYNIMDNIKYLNLEDELKKTKARYIELKKSIGELDHEKIIKEKNRILKEIDKINSNRFQLQGTKNSLLASINELEKELKDSKYENAKEKYTDSVIKEAILKNIVSDLHKYRSVLEKALLKFHQEKMDQINKIIRSLWNDIYRGNDIDFIMIKTDEESSTSASEKKRSYNYRVCQQKLGGELSEMRGRCSAGQKVLASLIIRIALADTFSTKCGILALDEPTTNLDQVNVKSLSEALSRLVAQRNDGNFMLIVITHDESFIQSLEQSEKYSRVSRNHKGLSVIEDIRYV